MNDVMDAQQHLNAEESHAMRYFDTGRVKSWQSLGKS
jgi:hypothetical protein